MRQCSEESCSGHGYVIPKETNSSTFHCECLCEEHYSGEHCEIVSPCRDVECFNRGKCVVNSSQEAECKCSREVQLFINPIVSGNVCQVIEVSEAKLWNSKNRDCIPCAGSFQQWYYCMESALRVDSEDLDPLWNYCEDDEGHRCWDLLHTKACLHESTCTVSVDYCKFNLVSI